MLDDIKYDQCCKHEEDFEGNVPSLQWDSHFGLHCTWTSFSFADVCLHYFGRLCTQTQLQSVARHSVAVLPRRRCVFFLFGNFQTQCGAKKQDAWEDVF